jgi:ABC-type transport system involved in multi-copper enzyme maturation permease subunit
MKTLLKIWAIVAYTFRESFAKKTFMAFFLLSSILHLFFIFAVNIDLVDGALAMVDILGNTVDRGRKIDIEKMIIDVESGIAVVVYSGGIFLSIFATANLVPNMLEKGSVDLLVSKPLSRPLIFIGRYLGALAIMIFNVSYLVLGSWLILSVKTGFWYAPYLYSIPVVVVAFAIIYALVSLIGVTTRSTGVSIMVAYAVLFFSPFLIQKDRIYALLSSKVYYYVLEGLYHVLPKTFEMGEINRDLVLGRSVGEWSAVWTSSLAGGLMLLFATFIFSKKDF